MEEKTTIVDEFFLHLEAEFARVVHDYRSELVAAIMKVENNLNIHFLCKYEIKRWTNNY